ncbi:hypothetical protein NCAS_0F00110 [Naumovozyma castellii]|uniref:Flo11 domain-containing protein n=1 Tax=Naumovozyma castellii TaxID=27288 RepID=G0VG75_NAUCA|nr:hypothetical protein NCAS_0F00110 [Naumovozyma castellii CBS 4309]CCC70495.1 hypothetical protein NCAS_0F00110 [Naumovozyma castellii CBS 4309]
MQSIFLVTFLIITQALASIISFPEQKLQKRDDSICQSITNGCPDLNFNWHASTQNIMQYSMDLQNVCWLHDNLYEITIQVLGAEQIDLKYLYSLKIIGIDGPVGTVQLYGANENTYLIDNPTNYTVTFQIYGDNEKDTNNTWIPNFQIQYEYLQGKAYAYADTWVWGTTSFDLMTGCNNYDNQGNSQTDFPGFYWRLRSLKENVSSSVQSLSSIKYESSISSTFTSMTFSQSSLSPSFFNSLITTSSPNQVTSNTKSFISYRNTSSNPMTSSDHTLSKHSITSVDQTYSTVPAAPSDRITSQDQITSSYPTTLIDPTQFSDPIHSSEPSSPFIFTTPSISTERTLSKNSVYSFNSTTVVKLFSSTDSMISIDPTTSMNRAYSTGFSDSDNPVISSTKTVTIGSMYSTYSVTLKASSTQLESMTFNASTALKSSSTEINPTTVIGETSTIRFSTSQELRKSLVSSSTSFIPITGSDAKTSTVSTSVTNQIYSSALSAPTSLTAYTNSTYYTEPRTLAESSYSTDSYYLTNMTLLYDRTTTLYSSHSNNINPSIVRSSIINNVTYSCTPTASFSSQPSSVHYSKDTSSFPTSGTAISLPRSSN